MGAPLLFLANGRRPGGAAFGLSAHPNSSKQLEYWPKNVKQKWVKIFPKRVLQNQRLS